MKKSFINFLFAAALSVAMTSCSSNTTQTEDSSSASVKTEETAKGGQSSVVDNESQKDVVKVAAGSPDHTTLVKAIQAAGLVDALSNAGPFTVFAPVNAAFDKLPAGTLDNLLKPENKDALADILQYHVTVSVYDIPQLRDGQVLGEVNGQQVTVHVKDGKVAINDANIIGTVRASNGIVHIIDKVLLPAKK